jgi:hypothetical protein
MGSESAAADVQNPDLGWSARVLSHSLGGNPNPMVSFRRFAILLALSLPAMAAVQAQSSSSSSLNPTPSSATPDQNQTLAQNQPAGEAAQASGETQGQISVQERIRQRRAQRRSTAIHDAYDHKWESYMDMGYLRFKPGPSLQRLTYYAWETGLTRFSNERLGFTLVGRGYYGTAFVGVNPYSQGRFTRPAISQYDVIGVPCIASTCSRSSRSPGARWAAGRMEISQVTRMEFHPPISAFIQPPIPSPPA